MIFVTQQGQADAEKARREREQPGCSLDEAEAAAAARQTLEGHVVARDEDQAAGGAYESRGVTDGPGPRDALEPGQFAPRDFQRGPLTEGHAAVSPGHEPPNRQVPVMPPGTAVAAGGPADIPHVDLSASQARAGTPDAAAFASVLSRPEPRRG
jgi:hypothetical protein